VAIWNDPSVLKEGLVYSMWASLGAEARGVAIYKLASLNGRTWAVANNGNPVLDPGNQDNGDPDWFGVETPAVIKVGGTYHMYYSFLNNGTFPFYSMAHATSTDGVTWRRHGELTTLTSMIGQPEGNRWGWLTRAEPGVVYLNNAFYLYYAEARCHAPDCSGVVPSMRGIALAASSDGHHFVEIGTEPVLLQSSSYRFPKDGTAI
jgi:predicted GH43/DUF377 family glycosyl hydrolase